MNGAAMLLAQNDIKAQVADLDADDRVTLFAFGGGQRGEMGGGGEGVDGAALQAARPKSPREREQEKHQKAQTIIKELLRGGPPPQRAGAGPPSYGSRR